MSNSEATAVSTVNAFGVAGRQTAAHPQPIRWRLSWRWAHKWGGIISALWLAILGVTGFLLDHRDWRWIWQTQTPEILIPDQFRKEHERAGFTVYRINPWDRNNVLAGGRQGLWIMTGAKKWTPSGFKGMSGSPQVLALFEDQRVGWNRLYLATDDGVWLSKNGGRDFAPFALPGEYVNAISPGHDRGELLCVVDKSRLYEVDTLSGETVEIKLKPAGGSVVPGEIGLSRFVHDLHFGRGIVSGLGSLLINDAGGILMVALPITGLLFWLLPLRWRKKEGRATHQERMRHRFTMKFLHRSHGLYMGIICVIPVVYLSVTGIILDHRDALNPWMKKHDISMDFMPPVYSLDSWEGEISSVMGYMGDPRRISLGARSGLYTTRDGGESWFRENLPGPPSCYVWSMSRLEDSLFVGGMGCPNVILSSNGTWSKVNGAGHMPLDAAMLGEETITMLSHGALYSGTIKEGFTRVDASFPKPDGAPLFTFLDGLHSGLIIHEQWIWINDLVSVLAIFLCVSGVVRIWRSRRVVARDFRPGT
ncbi:MAG: PepSY domain-containing protein [Nitrospinota bacterium]|nr:PepSY domain-containing protein [Nitrospinota bacterium]